MESVSRYRSFRRKLEKSYRRLGLLGTARTIVTYLTARAYRLTPNARRVEERERQFDAQFGVDTAGIVELSDLPFDSPSYEFGHRYQASAPAMIRFLIGEVPPPLSQYTFVDIGSGKGRALLVASEFPFKRIIGVEFAPQLHAVAQANIAAYHSDAQQCLDIESVCQDAAQFALPDGPLVIHLYHPFEEPLLLRFIAGVERSCKENPRPIYVLYQNSLSADAVRRESTSLVELKVDPSYVVYRVGDPGR